MSLLELYCHVDDFWQTFEPQWRAEQLASGERQRHRPGQLHPSEIMTLVIGMLGMAMSLLLLFAPSTARNLSTFLNRSMDVDKKLLFLDKSIRTDELIYGHPVIVGGGLVAASLFALIFFFFKVDIAEFTRIFFGPTNNSSLGEIIFQAVVWIGKVACFLGLAFGLCLMASPETMRRIERKLNTYMETRSLVERPDGSSHDIDAVFFRYPIFFGLLRPRCCVSSAPRRPSSSPTSRRIAPRMGTTRRA